MARNNYSFEKRRKEIAKKKKKEEKRLKKLARKNPEVQDQPDETVGEVEAVDGGGEPSTAESSGDGQNAERTPDL